MGCLHDPANVQQTSSKCIQNTHANAGRLLVTEHTNNTQTSPAWLAQILFYNYPKRTQYGICQSISTYRYHMGYQLENKRKQKNKIDANILLEQEQPMCQFPAQNVRAL